MAIRPKSGKRLKLFRTNLGLSRDDEAPTEMRILFERTFEQTVAPVLFGLGFREVRPPHDWIAPTKLFESENRWFGASWDPRELYLDVALGQLFRFRDVLPRAIVRGHYRHSASCTTENTEGFLANHLMQIAQEIPAALERFEARVVEALETDRTPSEHATRRERRVFREYRVRVGDPIDLKSWSGSQILRAGRLDSTHSSPTDES